jgi:effector-binding domain-containing protein
MSKEKNNDYISYRSSKIVFCQDGRILSTDKDDEIVDLRDCENCKQKDQRIAELEKQVKIKEIAFLNEIPWLDYYLDWEKFGTDKERQLYIKKRLEQAEEELKNREGK